MKWTSVLAIYFLIFCFSAFLLLPFKVRTHEEMGASACPARPTVRRIGSICPSTRTRCCDRRAADRAICRQLPVRLDHGRRSDISLQLALPLHCPGERRIELAHVAAPRVTAIIPPSRSARTRRSIASKSWTY